MAFLDPIDLLLPSEMNVVFSLRNIYFGVYLTGRTIFTGGDAVIGAAELGLRLLSDSFTSTEHKPPIGLINGLKYFYKI